MKKQWRMIIISCAVLAALLVTWLVSSLLAGGGTTETSETTAAVPAVFETKAEDISRVDVANKQASFAVLPETTTDSAGKSTLTWHVEGKEDYPFSESSVSAIGELAASVAADDEIAANVTDLKSYGLAEPLATLTVTLKSGEKHVIKFGDEITSGMKNYAMLDDTGRICTVDSGSFDKANYSLLDLLDKSQVVGIANNDLTNLTFKRAKDQVEISAECTLVGDSQSSQAYLTFKVTSPVEREGSADQLSTLATESTGLSVSKFIELDPADLAQYGLDKPQYTFILKSKDKTVEIKLGSKSDDSHFYAISDAVPAVFTVETGAFTLLDMKMIEMIDRFVSLESIWEVDGVEANLFGTRFTAEIAQTKDEKSEDETVVYKLDGQDAKIFSETNQSLFSQFYQRLIGMQLAGLDLAATPVNTHENSLIYSFKADEATGAKAYTKKIEFTKRDDYTYYFFIDGKYAGFYVDGEAAFTSDETGSEGVIVAYKKIKYAMEHAVDGVFNTEEGYQLD